MYYVRRDSIAVLADVGAGLVVLFLPPRRLPGLPRGTCVRRRVCVNDRCDAEAEHFSTRDPAAFVLESDPRLLIREEISLNRSLFRFSFCFTGVVEQYK